jgi:MFS family permease
MREGFDRKLIAPMVLGSILNPINSSIIAVSLVPIGMAFGAPPSQTAWLISGLYIATAIGQPVLGRMVDAYGPRRLFMIGAALAGVGGLLGTFAPSLGFLIVARVVLGFGTCAGYPAAMYLIRSEADRTGRESPASILTVLAVSGQTIAVIGPTLGGLLIGLGGWRATFAINVVLAIACVVVGARRLPKNVVGEGGLGRLSFTSFLDLRVLVGNAPLVITYARTLLAYIVSYAFLYGYTQWLEEERRLSPSVAGLVLFPIFATGIAVSVLTGRSPAVRAKLIVGSVSQIAACVALLFVDASSSIWVFVGISMIVGIPQGLVSLANQNALYAQADPERMGSSAGLLRTFTYLGAIVASVATGAFLSNRADTAGLRELTWFMLTAAGLFLVISVFARVSPTRGVKNATQHH